MAERADSTDRDRLQIIRLAQLRYPGLVGLHPVGRDGAASTPFLIERIEGERIVAAVAREGPPLLVDLAAEALRALAFLHDSGVVHRGLEPGNLLVRREPRLGCRLVMTEFAPVLRGETGLLYKAPELLDDDAVTDPRSDLYALGAVLFTAVHGRPPFRPKGDDAAAFAAAVRAGRRARPALPPGYPAGLHDLIEELLVPEPASRPAGARSALARMNELCGTDCPFETAAGRSARLASAPPEGREPAYRRIRDLLAPSAGSGVIWLCGEAGSGKKRLMRWLGDDAATRDWEVGGADALAARWGGHGAASPLLVLLGETETGEAGVEELVLRAAIEPNDPPLKIVASLLPSQAESGRLKRILDLSGKIPTLHRVDLEPLDLDGLAALVARATGDRSTPRSRLKRLHEASRGNLSAAEVLAVGGDDPRAVIDALTPAAAAALEALAVARDRCAEDRVARVAAIEPDAAAEALWELSAAGLAHGSDRTWTIEQPEIARQALAGLDADRRRSMSDRLDAAGPGGIERAASLAAGRGDLRGEVAAGREAVAKAFRRGRYSEVIRAASDLEPRALLVGDDESYRRCRVWRGRALAACGRAAEAAELLEGSPDDPARLARVEARLLAPHPDHDAVRRLLNGPLARARGRHDPDGLPWASALEAQRTAQAELASGRFADAAEAARAAADAARQADLPALEARAHAVLVEALDEQSLGEEAERARSRGRSVLEQAVERIDDPDLRRGFEEQPGLSALHDTASIAGSAANVRLLALYKMIRAVNSEADPARLLESILDMALRVVHAERGMILLRDDATGEFVVRLARGVEKETAEDAEAFSRHIVAQAGAGKPVLALDALRDERFRELKSVSLYGIHSLMCVPLRSRGTIIGTVYLDNRRDGRLFTPEDLRFLEAFADHAALALENSRARTELQRDNLRLQAEAESAVHYGNLVGRSPGMLQVFDLIDKVAASELTVLIQGESGTGKELVARAIHFGGPRRKRAFISENCAALPDSLLQSELFGHVRGSFTGAERDRAGMFEQADGGTLFLDEIGDMSSSMQAQILRMLEEGEVRRVGGDHAIKVDVRLITATHRDLRKRVAEGRFREDLLYRLQVLVIPLPPLRERPGDIRLLAEHFLGRIAAERGRSRTAIDADVLERIQRYSWPGNVRQLENTLQRLTLLAGDGPITGEIVDLDPGLSRMLDPRRRRPASPLSLQQSERDQIAQALAASKGNRTRAARMLGISRATIYRKIKEYRL